MLMVLFANDVKCVAVGVRDCCDSSDCNVAISAISTDVPVQKLSHNNNSERVQYECDRPSELVHSTSVYISCRSVYRGL